MQVDVTCDNHTATIILTGRFDFSSHREFRSGYESALQNNQITELAVDLGEVTYLDSSALGMLLMLKEKATAANKSVVLANCRGIVAQVLEVANFNKLFAFR